MATTNKNTMINDYDLTASIKALKTILNSADKIGTKRSDKIAEIFTHCKTIKQASMACQLIGDTYKLVRNKTQLKAFNTLSDKEQKAVRTSDKIAYNKAFNATLIALRDSLKNNQFTFNTTAKAKNIPMQIKTAKDYSVTMVKAVAVSTGAKNTDKKTGKNKPTQIESINSVAIEAIKTAGSKHDDQLILIDEITRKSDLTAFDVFEATFDALSTELQVKAIQTLTSKLSDQGLALLNQPTQTSVKTAANKVVNH